MIKDCSTTGYKEQLIKVIDSIDNETKINMIEEILNKEKDI